MKKNTLKKILFPVVVAGVALSIALAAFANENNDDHEKNNFSPRDFGSTLEVHINDNGSVLVRGARVSSVSGNTIMATTTFGSYVVTWDVRTNNTTNIVRKQGDATVLLPQIQVGDFISFKGALDTSMAQPTVNATIIKDWNLIVENNLLEKTTFQGTLKSLPGMTAPTTFMMTINGVDFTVNVPAGISVLNGRWLVTSLANFKVGDTVRVYGAIEAGNHSVIDASVVRDTNI